MGSGAPVAILEQTRGSVVAWNGGPTAAAGFRTNFLLVGATVTIVAVFSMPLMDPETDRARYAGPQGSFGPQSDLRS